MSQEGSQSNEPTAEIKEAPQTSDRINIKVVAQDSSEVFFKIKKTTPLRKLMDTYCQRQGLDQSSIRFLYDGNRIREDQTPGELGMSDGDIIDAVLQQIGGMQ